MSSQPRRAQRNWRPARRRDGTILTWNSGAERLHGYGEREIVGAHFSRFFTRRRPAAVDGESRRLLGFAKVTRDLSDRRRAAMEEQLHLLADSIPQLAWIADETGWIFWYNRRWYEYTGTTPEQMEGSGWQSVHAPHELPRILERFKRALQTGERWEDTFPLRSRSGQWRWFLSRAVPIRNTEGEIFRWFGTNTDLTEQVELFANTSLPEGASPTMTAARRRLGPRAHPQPVRG